MLEHGGRSTSQSTETSTSESRESEPHSPGSHVARQARHHQIYYLRAVKQYVWMFSRVCSPVETVHYAPRP
eukprot:7267543-Prymnesium_polylepis.1